MEDNSFIKDARILSRKADDFIEIDGRLWYWNDKIPLANNQFMEDRAKMMMKDAISLGLTDFIYNASVLFQSELKKLAELRQEQLKQLMK